MSIPCPPARTDPDLQAIVYAWPTLPDDVRRTILGVVRLSGWRR